MPLFLSYTVSVRTWRFLTYSVIGIGTFLLDLSLSGIFIKLFGMPYQIATALSFLTAININYAISRVVVFTGSTRPWKRSYVYFMCIALIGTAVTTSLVVLLVDTLALYYVVARFIVAGIVGTGNYLFNAHINFTMMEIDRRG